MKGLKIQANHFKKLARNSQGYTKIKYETYEKVAQKEADGIRLIFDIKPEQEETMEKLKIETGNNYRVKFDKFKKMGKRKWICIIGSNNWNRWYHCCISNITQNRSTGCCKRGIWFGKRNLSKLGPLFSALGCMLSTVLGVASQALMWISNNVWILLVFLAMFLWRRFGNRK